MKNSILFMKSNLKRNMIALLLVIITGFVLCSMANFSSENFSTFSTKQMQVAVIDNDKSQISRAFIEYLESDLGIKVTTSGDFDYFSNQLIERQLSVIIEIPKNYEASGIKNQTLGVFEVTALDDYENVIFINLYIDSFLQSIDMIVNSAKGDNLQFERMMNSFQMEQIDVKTQSAYIKDAAGEQAVASVLLSSGFYCMFVFFIGMSMAYVILDDRLSGVFERIKTTPVKVTQYILGTSVFTIIMGILPVIIFVLYLNVKGVKEVIPYGTLIMFMVLFNLIAVSFCLMAAILCKTRAALLSVIMAFSSIGPILGGAYFPIVGVSDIIDKLSKLMPHYWYMQAIRNLLENPTSDIRINVIILLLFVVLFTLIAGGKFVQKEEGRV